MAFWILRTGCPRTCSVYTEFLLLQLKILQMETTAGKCSTSLSLSLSESKVCNSIPARWRLAGVTTAAKLFGTRLCLSNSILTDVLVYSLILQSLLRNKNRQRGAASQEFECGVARISWVTSTQGPVCQCNKTAATLPPFWSWKAALSHNMLLVKSVTDPPCPLSLWLSLCPHHQVANVSQLQERGLHKLVQKPILVYKGKREKCWLLLLLRTALWEDGVTRKRWKQGGGRKRQCGIYPFE